MDAEMPNKRKRSRKGGGSVYRPSYQTKDGRTLQGEWRIRFRYKDERRQTKIHDERAPVNSKGAAQEYLNQRMAEFKDRKNQKPVAVDAENLRYENLRDALLIHYELEGKHVLKTARDKKTKYLSEQRAVDAYFKDWLGLNMDTVAIDTYRQNRMNDGAGKASINNEVAYIHRMFTFAVEQKRLTEVHVPRCKKFKVAARQGFVEPSTFPRLKEALPEYLRPVVTLGFNTGMRLGEIRNLRWNSVDLLAGEIRLAAESTKTHEARIIPLGRLVEVLRIMREKRPHDEYVFSTTGHKPLGDFGKTWETACVASGFGQFICKRCDTELINAKCEDCKTKKLPLAKKYRGLTFHDLRRSAVRNMVRAHIPEKVAMKISGHKTRAVFDRYNIASNDDLHEAAKVIDGYVDAAISKRQEKETTQSTPEGTTTQRLIN